MARLRAVGHDAVIRHIQHRAGYYALCDCAWLATAPSFMGAVGLLKEHLDAERVPLPDMISFQSDE